ncbi:hypothetical protein K490DRAFT_39589, partial [Saccharata proteae CBS 121410]
ARERVVILGSGWAGYTLARELDSSKYQAVVVSPRSYFVFTPLLASTSVGTLEFRTALEPVRSHRTNVNFFQGWGDQVNFNNKTITIEEAVDDPQQGVALVEDRYARKSAEEKKLIETPGNSGKMVEASKGRLFDIKYDKLIVTVGCYSQTFNTPGVKEHALFLKDVGDARRIRNRILQCFETAALPTTSDEMRRHLLNFAIVGGGPTGIEFSAELNDIIREDLSHLYPDLMSYYKISIYDVAPKVLSMFDENLGRYAMRHFAREGIEIKTSHHVEWLRRGVPGNNEETVEKQGVKDPRSCWTLKVKEEGEVGVGMVVWSTGLMMNPFIRHALGKSQRLPYLPPSEYAVEGDAKGVDKWSVMKHPRSGSIMTDKHLRVLMEPEGQADSKTRAAMRDVYALGDCAVLEGTMYPATAQVASQKATWLAKRLNKGDVEQKAFTWKNMGVMAYVGNWNAVMQTNSAAGNLSGRAAWIVWRGAYLTKAMSWRNKILIPLYW